MRAVGERGRALASGSGPGLGRLRINNVSYFEGVPESAWSFVVGGYQLLYKWLADRKKTRRNLTNGDIEHYRRLVGICLGTMELMDSIDETVRGHGGWPNAFDTSDATSEAYD